MKRICVCGAGTMGAGIAQVIASAGFATTLYDLNKATLENARNKVANDLQTLVGKKKIGSEEREAILCNIKFTSEQTNCIGDLIIEAIIEKEDAKVDLFNALALINDPETIFATNTSSLSISHIASRIRGPERFAGLHFFNPAPVMKLVEVVRGRQTSEPVMQGLVRFANLLGKHVVICLDSPGFIVNRVARPYYLESLRLMEQGIADFETIDMLLENAGFRMGPFKLMDLIGNDINYAVSNSIYQALNKADRLKPSYIQGQKITCGKLGKKTGKGYYEY